MKSKVLTKSLRGISQILTAFVCCCVLGFATTTSANAQNDYPLNVTVELTGVAHNMDDGLGTPEVVYQINGETIIVDGNFLGFDGADQDDFVPFNMQLLTRTVSCAELANLTGPAPATALVTLPPFTGEEDDCTVLSVGCNGFSIIPPCEGDDYCISGVVNQFDVLADAALGQGMPGIYTYVSNYAADGVADAYQLRLRVTVIPDTQAESCNAVVDCGATIEFDRYSCNNDQTDVANATADAHAIITSPAGLIFTVVESVGVTFPYTTTYAPDGKTLNFAANASPIDFAFNVVKDQPWFIKLVDENGCTLYLDGVLDLPSPDILGLQGQYCLDDAPNFIYDGATFEAGEPLGPFGVTVVGEFFGNGITDNGNGSAVFDPFIAGTGQHLISYLILDYGVASGNADYVSCEVQADALVNIYPVFYPSFDVDETICVDGGNITLTPDGIASILADFAALETEFDPQGVITEADSYVSFAGVGVTNNLDGTGTATFDPSDAGVGTHAVELTVGYPACPQTYVVSIEVVETIVATIEDRTFCASTSEQIDLTGMFTATTSNGGTFAMTNGPIAGVSVNGNALSYDSDAATFPIVVEIEYTVGDPTANGANCFGTGSAELTILDGQEEIHINATPEHVCAGTTLTLTDYLSGVDVNTATGSFSFAGTAAGDVYTPGAFTLAIGNDQVGGNGRVITITYSQDNGTCITEVATSIYVVDPSIPDPQLGNAPVNVCEFDDCVNLFDAISAGNTNGTFFINGVESLTGIMCPWDYSGDVTVDYVVSSPEGCEESATTTITIVEGPNPEFVVANNWTGNGVVGNTVSVSTTDDLTEICSREACYLLVTETQPELLPTWDGLAGNDQTAVAPATLVATVTIPASSLAANLYFNDLAFIYDYTTTPGSTVSQGDHDGFTIELPGLTNPLVNIPDEANPAGEIAPGNDNHFESYTLEVVVDGMLVEPAASAYAAAAAAAGFDGTAWEYFLEQFTACEEVSFVYTLETNAAQSAISLELVQEARAVDVKGDMIATLHETGTNIMDWNVITLDGEPFAADGSYSSTYGYYSFCTQVDGIDLAAYDEIDVTFITSDCDATNDADELCSNSYTNTLIILESANADLNTPDAICTTTEFDLEMLFTDATTQGGTFSASAGTITGNYLNVDVAAGDTLDVTITYAVGEGSLCDPADGTTTLTVYGVADADVDYPETVCLGAIPALPAGTWSTADGSAPTVAGLYTITNSAANGPCTDEFHQEVLVALGADIVVANDTIVACVNYGLNLTTNVSSSIAGSFSGVGVSGNIFLYNATGPQTITYTVNGECAASATFVVNVLESANADFDAPESICSEQTVDLTNWFAGTTPGGTFTATAGTVNGNMFTAPAAEGTSFSITYTVGEGVCQETHTETLVVSPIAQASTEGYGFVCQSEDDFSIDLTQYIDDGLINNPQNNNGGFFNLGVIPPFISEIEYDANNDQEFVEITAAEGVDLSNYALYFYERTDYADMDGFGNSEIDGGVEGGKSSGRIYNIIPLQGVVGTVQNDPLVGNVIAAQDYTYTYNGSTFGVDLIADGTVTQASSGVSYGAVAFDGTFDIKAGPAGFALVDLARAAAIQSDLDGTPVAIADLDLEQLDYRHNDAVVQFIGYGTDMENTNYGIFSSCDGPAASMVSVDINVVDGEGAARSLQFTNACWVRPNIDDEPLAYNTSGSYDNDNFDAAAIGQDSQHDGNAGSINYGMSLEGADEFYFDYIAPDGDILLLDRLCQSLFAVNQIVDVQEDLVDNQPGTIAGEDEGLVRFNCTNPTYTVPFGYQTANHCGNSAAAGFNLTVLMDLDASWSAPKTDVCESADPFSLTDLINDDVQFIQPYHYTGSFEASAETTLTENMNPPIITELHTDWYGYNEDAADDHCILYNYVDDAGTPFNFVDDQYEQLWICEGIEITAPVGTDLSCYGLVFYSDEVDGDPNSVYNALGHDVAYIDADGQIVETDVTNGIYMDLYGSVTADNNTEVDGTIMYTPTFGYIQWTTDEDLNGFPYYAGHTLNPFDPTQEAVFGLANETAASGLYLDENGNNEYDLGETQLNATDFPWDRNNGNTDNGVGSRWFPIVDVPENTGGVGFYNKCTGELLDFISWGGQLQPEPKANFSEAGLFEQICSTVIDTTQAGTNGDVTSLQYVDCATLNVPANCNCDEEGGIWIVVYKGQSATIPMCDGAIVEFETSTYSSSFGNINLGFDTDYFEQDIDAFSLDLTSLLDNTLEGLDEGVSTTGILPNNAIITSHIIEVTIGTGNSSDFQVYTYDINTDNCAASLDVSEETSVFQCSIGDLDTAFTDDEVCQECADVSDNACIVGEFIDAAPFVVNGGGDYDIDANGNFDGNPDYSPTDESTVPGIQDGNDGLLELGFYDGNGEDAQDNNCYIGECTSEAKTSYNVTNLMAYIYDGNEFTPKEDSCYTIIKTPETYTVSIKVKVEYMQCVPIGNFYSSLDNGSAAPMFGMNATDGPITVNTEDWDTHFWEFNPAGLAEFNDLEVTYDVTNYNEIEADNVTDDLACTDDDTNVLGAALQEISIIPGGVAQFAADAATTACTGETINLAAMLSSSSDQGGTFTINGAVVGSNFTPTAAGSYTVTYSVGGGECSNPDDLTITVGESGSTPMMPAASACTLAPMSLDASASWSGDAGVVSGNTFTPAASGTYTLNWTSGSGDCAVSGSTTVTVTAAVNATADVSEIGANGMYSVTITLTGGNGTYTVNGEAIAGNTYTGSVQAPAGYTFVIASGGCPSVTVLGDAPEQLCTPEAGTLSAAGVPTSVLCVGTQFTLATVGNNTNANTVFAVTDAAGNVVAVNQNGLIGAPATAGTYDLWVVNTCDAIGSIPSTVDAIAAAAAAGSLDIDGPISVTVAPELSITATGFCDDAFGGYLIEVTVDGGAPAESGFGSYSLNYPILSGTLTGTPPLTAVIEAGNGTPFPAGASVSVSVDSDGSLCEAFTVVSIDTEACGINGEPNTQNTLVDEPTTFNVLDNDNGVGVLTVTNVIQPNASEGTVVWTPDGQFTFIPAPGFTGTSTFVYEFVDAVGQTASTTVTVIVEGNQAAPLVLDVTEDCTGSETTGVYTLIVTVQGGVPPYSFSGASINNFELNEATSFPITGIADGSSYEVIVTDLQGAVETEAGEVACSKVAVELLSFSGSVETDGDLLRWVTASEFNNDFFTLEHSVDGINYEVIATVEGAGTSTTANTYSELYKDAAAGTNYYRLSATDFDGSVNTYAPITLVRGETGLGFVNLFPVPATNVLNVSFTSVKNAPVKMEVYNIAGKLINILDVDATQGINQATINVSTYAAGTYFMSINDGDAVTTTRFVVE